MISIIEAKKTNKQMKKTLDTTSQGDTCSMR